MNLIINHLGFKQGVNDKDEYVCPLCQASYTNEGKGVICEFCDEKFEELQQQDSR